MGSGIGFLVVPLTTISHVFLRFKVFRFSIDQIWIFRTSPKDKSGELDLIGTLNVMSSAQFTRRKVLVWVYSHDVIYHDRKQDRT